MTFFAIGLDFPLVLGWLEHARQLVLQISDNRFVIVGLTLLVVATQWKRIHVAVNADFDLAIRVRTKEPTQQPPDESPQKPRRRIGF